MRRAVGVRTAVRAAVRGERLRAAKRARGAPRDGRSGRGGRAAAA
jgi:hypothetical protein